jgi:hypothetical protein
MGLSPRDRQVLVTLYVVGEPVNPNLSDPFFPEVAPSAPLFPAVWLSPPSLNYTVLCTVTNSLESRLWWESSALTHTCDPANSPTAFSDKMSSNLTKLQSARLGQGHSLTDAHLTKPVSRNTNRLMLSNWTTVLQSVVQISYPFNSQVWPARYVLCTSNDPHVNPTVDAAESNEPRASTRLLHRFEE